MMNPETFTNDTIAAVATPQGSGGIAVIKLSGPGALDIVTPVFHSRNRPEDHPREMIHGTIQDHEGRIDEVLCCYMRAPRSYTGEDVVEVQTHGGRAAATAVLDLLIARGARPAEPGEFTRRAFLNGKIDLVQAEAIQQVVDAESRESLRSAERLLSGQFSRLIEDLRSEIAECAGRLELTLDFSDQTDDSSLPANPLSAQLEHLESGISTLLGTCDQARRIRDGIRTVIAGAVNVGKSSLFNTLLGKTRAIVNTRPGTTRDWIEDRLELGGYLFILSDTAGIRDTDDEIEQEGVRESHRLLQSADLILHLLGPDEPGTIDPLYPPERTILLGGKSDLIPDSDRRPDILPLSPITGEGIESLRSVLIARARFLTEVPPESGIILVERHRFLLTRTRDSVRAARLSLETWSEEIAALELSAATQALDTLLGIQTAPDVLDTVFRNFCIGK